MRFTRGNGIDKSQNISNVIDWYWQWVHSSVLFNCPVNISEIKMIGIEICFFFQGKYTHQQYHYYHNVNNVPNLILLDLFHWKENFFFEIFLKLNYFICSSAFSSILIGVGFRCTRLTSSWRPCKRYRRNSCESCCLEEENSIQIFFIIVYIRIANKTWCKSSNRVFKGWRTYYWMTIRWSPHFFN